VLQSAHLLRTGSDRRKRPRPEQVQGAPRDPRPRGKPEGFALFVKPDVAPEEIDDIGGARLVFGSGQTVEIVGKFFRYLDDDWHGFLGRRLDWLPV